MLEEIELYVYDKYIKEKIINENGKKKIAKEYLEKLVKECSPYLEEAEIKAMEYDELIKEIQTSRKETAKLF